MTPTQKLIDQLGVNVSVADQKRLMPHLSGWNHLNEILLLNGAISTDDLRKLVVLELAGARRTPVLRRLVTKLGTRSTQELWQLVETCASAKHQ